ncbi:unnamed protein product [Leptosia nina]|uniref:Peptidase A2 domain-containing protein n=1 Tax=Leptosia nina TaxID=320188 RepID=A0AAV1JJH0_9NEOP
MPVTRSQKEYKPADVTSPTSAATSATHDTTSGTTVTTEAEKTTVSTEATTASQPGHTMTLVPEGSTRRAGTAARSRASTNRRRLEAKEELARFELEEIQARARLELEQIQARARLEIEEMQARARLLRIRLEITEEDEEDSIAENEEAFQERDRNIRSWMEAAAAEPPLLPGAAAEEPATAGPATAGMAAAGAVAIGPTTAIAAGPAAAAAAGTVGPAAVKKEASAEVQLIAEALREALSHNATMTTQPRYIQELPVFEGDSTEWTAFQVVYDNTASLFSPVHNMARLRNAIKGEARESCKSLLYSSMKPEDVMEALRRRYGRPDLLVMAEVKKLESIPPIGHSPRELCNFANSISNSVAAIKSLNRPQFLHAPAAVNSIVEKIPHGLRYRWYEYASTYPEEAKYNVELVSAFLNLEADRCSAFAGAVEHKPQHPGATARKPQRYTTNNETRVAETMKCPRCEGNHRLPECPTFLKMSVSDRWDAVKKVKVCFKCLSLKHRKENCRKPPCKTCKRWHHDLLHVFKEIEQSAESVNTMRNSRALLKMIQVEVCGPKGNKKVMALLDEGSTVTLLHEKIADAIGARGSQEELTVDTVGGGQLQHQKSMKIDLELRGIKQHSRGKLKEVRTVKELNLTPQHLDKRRLKRYKHLSKIIDDVYYEAEKPMLLIGQDNWEYIVSLQVRRGKRGQPVASRTRLGWVLHGNDSNHMSPGNYVNTCAHLNTVEEELDHLVKEHFTIESLGIHPKRPSTDMEEQATRILHETSRRLENGRFEVGLLWKQDNMQLPNNYETALNRFKGIEKKLRKDSVMKKEYSSQIENLLHCQYAEEAPADCNSSKKWFLPHFAVQHPLKKKLRIVFDAAAKTAGCSLNDALLPGPDLLQSLFGVLLRFREGPVAIAADIKEMFLQVKIREEDRDSLRFLWRDNEKAPVKEYRMTSVIFGAASLPCTAIYVKNKNAQEYQEEFPEAARAIERNHYMDDYLQSFHSIEDCKRVSREVDAVHKKACFELRGWASNKIETINSEGAEEVDLGDSEEKTLGLRWLTRSDEIAFRNQFRRIPDEVASGVKTPTKREVTGAVMSTFDPLGLISPILIQGKKLIQHVWRSGNRWVEKNTQKDFTRYKTQLEDKRRLKTSGWLGAYHQHAPKGSFTHSRTPVRQPTPQWLWGTSHTSRQGRRRGADLLRHRKVSWSGADWQLRGNEKGWQRQLEDGATTGTALMEKMAAEEYEQGAGRQPEVEGAVLIADRTLPQCKWPRGQRRIQNPTEEHESSTRQREARHQPSSRIVLLVPATESPPRSMHIPMNQTPSVKQPQSILKDPSRHKYGYGSPISSSTPQNTSQILTVQNLTSDVPQYGTIKKEKKQNVTIDESYNKRSETHVV